MVRQTVYGFRKALFPALALVFLFLMMISAYETLYGVVAQKALLAAGIIVFFIATFLLLIRLTFFSYEYSLVCDTLVVRCRIFKKERHRYSALLSDKETRLYRGIRSWTCRGAVWHTCCFPFFGWRQPRVAIVFDGRGGKRVKLVLRPKPELYEALERVLSDRDAGYLTSES